MKATAAGVDTWSVGWYLDQGSKAHRAFEALATVPGPRSRMLEEKIAGHRVGWFPGSSLAFAEGHPSPEGLCPPGRLNEAYDRLVDALKDHGLVMPKRRHSVPSLSDPAVSAVEGQAGVRRLDLTVDIEFAEGSHGLAALSGVAATPIPRVQTGIRREAGGRAIETVALYGWGGKRMLGRWYDKGVEAGVAPRGALIRAEDQRRFAKGARLAPEALSAETVRALFQRRFVTLWKATEGITVGSVMRLAEKLRELRDRGVITGRQAERLAGHLVLEAADVRVHSRATKLRELGLVLADGVTEETEVDLHAVVEAALEADGWYEG